MKVFFIFYTQGEYAECEGQSVVLAEDFHSAIDKFERSQWGKKPVIRKIELYWEFPIL